MINKLPITGHFDIKNSQYVYQGFLKIVQYELCHELFNGHISNIMNREVVEKPPAVGVILYDPALDNVIMIEQFRVGAMTAQINPWMIEIVAGIQDKPNESLESLAHREAIEEANCHIKKLIYMTNYLPSGGSSSEVVTLYCGIVDSTSAGGVFGLQDENEDIKVHVIPFEQAMDLMKEQKINSSSALIALQWMALFTRDQLLKSIQNSSP